MVLLEVVKRMLVFLIKGDKVCKISNQQSIEISARLVGLRGQSPSNFNRQPRGLKDLCYWKATELRQFLLYLGPVVLKGIVSEKIYDHFLVLHVALSLLLKDEITEDVAVLDYAKNLLKYSLQHHHQFMVLISMCTTSIHLPTLLMMFHITNVLLMIYLPSSLRTTCKDSKK